MSETLFLPWQAPRVFGLSEELQDTLAALAVQWSRRVPRNHVRLAYMDMKTRLKDLSVSVPPELVEALDAPSGWAMKAVYEQSNRIVFEDIVGDEFDLAGLLRVNRFRTEFPQAVASSLAQSVSFQTVTPGRPYLGEPDVVIAHHSALWATGIWSRTARALTSGLIVNDVDALGFPTSLTMLVPGLSFVCVKGNGSWYVEEQTRIDLGPGRIPMEPLPFRPTLERPFGRSRIDRVVMSLIDRQMRANARLESHAELFSALKIILLGVDEDTFDDGKPLWSFYMGRLNTLTRDEFQELPKVEKITAESPEPHIAIKRDLAAEFSGHTGVPLGSLGIATDNPESAGAKQEARQDIIADAEAQHIVYGDALFRSLENAVMIRDKVTQPPAGFGTVAARWRPANRPTLAALADAGAKQVAAVPGLAESEVGLELMGLDRDQRERFMKEKRRDRSASLVADVLAAPREVRR